MQLWLAGIATTVAILKLFDMKPETVRSNWAFLLALAVCWGGICQPPTPDDPLATALTTYYWGPFEIVAKHRPDQVVHSWGPFRWREDKSKVETVAKPEFVPVKPLKPVPDRNRSRIEGTPAKMPVIAFDKRDITPTSLVAVVDAAVFVDRARGIVR